MQDMIVLNVDSESETGLPIAKRYSVGPLPTLLFLNGDGAAVDGILGYLPPEPFKAEIERILRGEGTIDVLKKNVEANPDDLDARDKLAKKLESVGDKAGQEKQIAEILKRDPEGKNAVTRRLLFDRVVEQTLDVPRGELPDPQPLVDYLANETDSALIHQGHDLISRLYTAHAEKNADDAAKAEEHRSKAFASRKLAWKHCPDEGREGFGNALAWSLWEEREGLDDDAKAFALEVAMAAAKSSNDANVLDTLACCYYMNGNAEKAIATIDRCIELQPDNAEWPKRRKMFEPQH